MWMSPNSAAKPLAFLDAATVDYDKYRGSDELLHCFEPLSDTGFACDYSKVYRMRDYPKDKKFGQIQLSYVAEAGHQWYYFDDLAEDEAVLFDGAERAFHAAFVPMEQTATEERVSAETSLASLSSAPQIARGTLGRRAPSSKPRARWSFRADCDPPQGALASTCSGAECSDDGQGAPMQLVLVCLMKQMCTKVHALGDLACSGLGSSAEMCLLGTLSAVGLCASQCSALRVGHTAGRCHGAHAA